MSRLLLLVIILCQWGPRIALADVKSELLSITEKEICPKILDSATCPNGGFPKICDAIAKADKNVIAQVQDKCATLQIPKPESIWDVFLKGLKPHYTEIIGVLIAGLLAALAWLKISFNNLRNNARKALSRLADPFISLDLEYDSRALNVVLVGEGGSGKTTIIRSLTAAPEAVPAIATDSISTYSLIQEMTVQSEQGEKRRLFRIFIDDYVGQNLPEALEDDAINNRLQMIPATLLVIVVDLFPYEKDTQNSLKKEIDTDRVAYQIGIYNEPVMQILLRRAQSSKYVVLFINKIDMISPLSPKKISDAIAAYKPLIEKLEDKRGRRLHVIVGSARAGNGVVGYDEGHEDQKSLLQIMHDASEPYNALDS